MGINAVYIGEIVRDIKIKTQLMNAQPRLDLRPRCWETTYDWAAYDLRLLRYVIQVHQCAACLACVVTTGVR